MLNRESLDESIARLDEMRMYEGPDKVPIDAYSALSMGIPVPCSHEIWPIHQVLHSRRFLKVHDELSRLPKDAAGRMVSDAILARLTVYVELFEGKLTGYLDALERNPGTGVAFGVYSADGSPTMMGLRFQLFSLVLLAGSLELPGAAAVDRVTEAALGQRWRLDGHDKMSENAACSWLYMVSLYNRQILASGFVGTEPDTEEARRRAHALGVGAIRLKLTKYDAERLVKTWQRESSGRPDFAGGSQQVSFCGALEYGQFSELITDPVTGPRYLTTAARSVSAQRPEKTAPVTLNADYHSMGDAVTGIQGSAVRVCFESRDFDSKTDKVSRGDRIAELERVAGLRELTAREALLLEDARQGLQDAKSPDAPYDLNFHRVSGKFACGTVDQLLGKLTQDSPYTWEKRGRTYVVFPRTKSVLDFPVTLHVRRQTLGHAINRILEQSPGPEMGLGSIAIGPGPFPEPGKRIIESLDLDGIGCREALCRAVQCVGDDVVWDLAGLKGGRTLFLRMTR